MADKIYNASKLILKVFKDESNDPESTLQRTFSHINPSLDDKTVHAIGQKLAALQSHGLVSITRTDSATLNN